MAAESAGDQSLHRGGKQMAPWEALPEACPAPAQPMQRPVVSKHRSQEGLPLASSAERERDVWYENSGSSTAAFSPASPETTTAPSSGKRRVAHSLLLPVSFLAKQLYSLNARIRVFSP